MHKSSCIVLAIDRSARTVDVDGRLHLERSHISKAAINPYYGSEIPGGDALGLEPTKIYYLFRDPVELERATSTFARIPILKRHVDSPITADDTQKDLIIGSIGSNVEFNAPYLDADLCFWDAAAIAGIDTGQIKELSCGYRYTPVMEAGTFEGQAYDGRMTDIRGNHLALVESGRAGSDVVVADHKTISTLKELTMKMSKLGAALFTALAMASPKLAADSALPALVGQANRKTFKKEDIKAKLLAIDADLNPEQLDGLLAVLLDNTDSPVAVEPPAPQGAADDDTPAGKLKALLEGKVDDETLAAALACCDWSETSDEDDDTMCKSDVKTAMDAMSVKLKAEMREANEARADVRGVVGDVVNLDSAAQIYGFALDHMTIDRTGVESVPALKALFKVASTAKSATTPIIAQDGAGLAARFPNATRFAQA